ncbi:gastrula zinc finger protein XlCGF8.2DB-like isoform X2 [Myripristis murdjan]|uniref:gastrula zinc finger protein XlCGF8.2DB-like isoform X2 n=1 Tax=Myripristis murdjan TaxID=586833 RepID=UPI0011762780|nr:gastrula zinc finger protein XlCGF8.2DB-like isoform X2 [Myripristis murdjan]
MCALKDGRKWRTEFGKMSELCELRSQEMRQQTAAIEERLSLLEKMLAEYKLQNSRLKLKVERQQRLLDAILLPEVRLHRVCKEEVPPEQQEPTPSLEPEPRHIKEEQEELWTNQQGEQPQDITKLLFTVVTVKSEDDEEEAQWNRGVRRSTGQMKAEDGGVPLSHDRPDVGEKPASCSKTENTGKSTFPCSICGCGFARKGSLKLHMGIHTGEKPFPCSICGCGFSRKESLKLHMGIHTEEKAVTCSVCGRGFTRKEHLKCHMRIHTGEKPFVCSVCGKAFAEKGHLNRHVRIHTGEKPFACSICGKGFTEKGTVNRHMKIHTGEKPCVCYVCGKGFSLIGNLKRHMGVHTGENL